MPIFSYAARTDAGKKMSGSIEANSERAAVDQLASQGFLITSIRLKNDQSLWLKLTKNRSSVSSDEMSMFYLQLGNMLEAGLPVLNALETTQAHVNDKRFSLAIRDVLSRIHNGESLSDGLAHFPDIFSSLYRRMIEVGETSGNLGKVLKKIAEANESQTELRRQVYSALAYPAVLMLASVSVVIFMIVWIVPSFVTIFEKANVALPLPTRLLWNLSGFIYHHSILILVFLVGCAATFWFALQSQPFRYRWDQFWLRTPVIGVLQKRIEIARWSENLGLMLTSGIPMLKALEISQRLVGNQVFQRALTTVTSDVQSGSKLAQALTVSQVFPVDVLQMIAVGETSGTIDLMLQKITSFYHQLVTRALRTLTAAIEPTFVLVMGVIVGVIMLSIFLPIFDMVKILKPS